jgi:hypothetical protein
MQITEINTNSISGARKYKCKHIELQQLNIHYQWTNVIWGM